MEQKMPDLSMLNSLSLELETILINDQKLLFDKKVKLVPVDIEEKPNANE